MALSSSDSKATWVAESSAPKCKPTASGQHRCATGLVY